MKKLVTIILAMCMLLVLFTGCNTDTGTGTDAGAPDSSAPNSSAPDSPAPASQEASSPAQESEDQELVAPASPTPSLAEDTSMPYLSTGTGFFTDDVDWFDRPAYKFAYISYNWMFIHETVADYFEKWGALMNYEFTSHNAGQDMTNFFSACESFAAMGYDGLFVDPDAVFANRTTEVLNELGIPWLPVMVPLRDSDSGKLIAPTVDLDGYNMCAALSNWLLDNYQERLPGVGLDEIGYLYMYVTINPNLIKNMEGARDAYRDAVPELFDTNFFAGDMLGYDLSAQGAFEYASTVITANPQFKYWFLTGTIEDLSLGAARAAEDLDIESNVIIVSNGANWIIQEWESGYDGSWQCATYYSYPYFIEALAAGVIAIIEGRATFETLWGPEWIPEGEEYPMYMTPILLVTKDTYVDVMTMIDSYMSLR